MGRRMRDLLAQAGTADYPLAPGLTLLRHYLEEAAQRALASEIAEIVALAPWFFPCMPRSGWVFSVKMTNCGRLGWVSDRAGGTVIRQRIPVPANRGHRSPSPC